MIVSHLSVASKGFSFEGNSDWSVHLEFLAPAGSSASNTVAVNVPRDPKQTHPWHLYNLNGWTNFLPHCQQSAVKVQLAAWIIHCCQVLLMEYVKWSCYAADCVDSKTMKVFRERSWLVSLWFFKGAFWSVKTFTPSLTTSDSFCCFDLLFGLPSLLFISLNIQMCMWATWNCRDLVYLLIRS